MAKDFSDLWAPVSRKEKARIKKEADEFLQNKHQESGDTPPSFDDAKFTLAGIENLDDRRVKLEEIIARYEIALADIFQQKEKYEHEHTDLIESGSMDDDRRRVESVINQIHRELEFFQTKLEHNDLDFKPLKKRTNLKKLYFPFDKHSAALYTGMSVSTIEKNPREWGAEMSCSPYEYYPDVLDEILANKKLVSPYWEYPELVVPAPGAWNRTEKGEEASGPRKILWKGKSPDSQIRELIEQWINHGYISLSSLEIGEYIAERFTVDAKDTTAGRFIHWLGGQKDLIAYIENLEDHGLLELKAIGSSNYMTQFITDHFRSVSKSGSVEPFKETSLSVARSKVKKIYDSSGKGKDRFTARAMDILTEVQKIVLIGTV